MEKISEKGSKEEAAIQNMLRIADRKITGRMSKQTCLKIMETMIILMIVHNSETWENIESMHL